MRALVEMEHSGLVPMLIPFALPLLLLFFQTLIPLASKPVSVPLARTLKPLTPTLPSQMRALVEMWHLLTSPAEPFLSLPLLLFS